MKVTKITSQAEEIVQKNCAETAIQWCVRMMSKSAFSLVGCSNLKGIIDIDCYSYLVSSTPIIHSQCRHCI